MPSPSYGLNPSLILRHEFYGGLIHSRSDGQRWEVTHQDATFLWILDQTGSPDAAIEITRRVHNDREYQPALSEMEKETIVTLSPSRYSDLFAVEKQARAIYADSLTRDFLRAPLNLSLYPRMACQLSCKFCYVTEEKWQKGYLDADLWIDLMRQARQCGVPFISFLGGDPSLYPQIGRLIRACDEIGIKGTITTNGLHLKAEVLASIIETEKITPTFSIQSLDGFHETLSGKPVHKTLSAVQQVLAADKECNINLVYTEQTDEQIVDLVDFCGREGVAKLSIGVFVNITHADLRTPSFSEYRRIYEKISAYISDRGYDLTFQVEGCQLYTAYPDIPNPIETEFERLTFGCEAGNGRAEVLHDGTLLPCALLEKSRWGDVNALELGLQEAWDKGKALKKIRSFVNRDSACSSCSYSSFCNGGCPAINEKEYGTIEAKGDPRCEIRNQLVTTIPQNSQLLPLTVLK